MSEITDSAQEQKIMMMMRKTLTSIIRDTTPEPGMRHPLNQSSLNDIRDCLVLISARERELAAQKGVVSNMKPHFVDEAKTSTVIPFTKIGRAPSHSSSKNKED